MFWNNLVGLCNENNISPSALAAKLGLSTVSATKWKKGTIPRDTTLKKIADYFGITVEDLLSDEEKKPVHVDEPTDIFNLSKHEIDLVKAYRTSEGENKKHVDRIMELSDTLENSLDLNQNEKKLILGYRNYPHVQAIIDKLLGVPDETRGVIIYHAANSTDNHPDGYFYISHEMFKKLQEAPDSYDMDL